MNVRFIHTIGKRLLKPEFYKLSLSEQDLLERQT